MNFCVHLSLGKIIIFIENKIHHKFSNMIVHSCCCILFCIAWFEVRFQIDLNLHFEITLEKLEKRKMSFFPPLPRFQPIGLLPRPWPLLRANPLAPRASLLSLRGPAFPSLSRGPLQPA